MRFINTSRFSPVALGIDKPWEDDYFHLAPEEITNEFLASGEYIIDEDWWTRQDKYCREGYTVPNAIEKGGDFFVDGIDAFWNESDKPLYVEELNKELPPNCCYLKLYDLYFYDKSVYITGRHYWYLNFWPIYGLEGDSKIKSITKPRFLDMDFLFAYRIKMQVEQEKDSSELKSRQRGYSEKAAGMIAGWNYTFVPASTTIIVAGEETDAEHTYENAIRGLDMLKNTQFYKNRAAGYNNKSVVRAKSSKSEIRCLTAKDKPQTVARYSPYWIIYEEIGKWKKGQVVATRTFAEPAMKAQGHKTGFATYIGTGGDMDQGASDFEKFHYYPHKYNMLEFDNLFEEDGITVSGKTGHFTTTLMFRIIDKDGNSLKQLSLASWEKEYEASSAEDKYNYKTQNPLYASHAFLISSGGFFSKEQIQYLNARRSYILTHKEAQVERLGRLEWINKDNPFAGVKFIDDEIDGYCVIVEEPDRDSNGKVFVNLYKAATDSYDQDESTTDSQGSCQIFKGFNPSNPLGTARKYVARLTMRPKTEEGGSYKFYEETAKLCIYYGNAINLIEYSKVRIIDWYEKNGLYSLLKERPEFVSAAMINKSKVTNKYGIDPATKPHWLTMLRDHLSKDMIDRMDDIYQIERLAKFKYDPTGKKYNCDTTITSALCIVLEQDEINIQISNTDNYQKDDDICISYQWKNGRMVQN